MAAEAKPVLVTGRHSYATAPAVEFIVSTAWDSPVRISGGPSIDGATGSSMR